MAILKVKDASGEWHEVPALKGDKGDPGEPSTVPGPPGHTPTEAELTALITPIVQAQLGVIENASY